MILDEHLAYLSLPHRQNLYDQAVAQAVKPGAVVADLGCGVGVLGLAALRAGAARVYGIDHSDVIELARESVARAGFGDRYHCLRGSTFQTVLPEQVDVILCDHVGYFGFDYGIIAMLDDARRRMLKRGGQVLPRRLRLMVAGASSATARARIDGWVTSPVPPDFHWLYGQASNTKQSHRFLASEIVTDAAALGEIDLTVDNPPSFSFDASLAASQDCRIDGIACWFECEIVPGVWMTNSPMAAESIGRENAFLAASEPFAMRAGEHLGVAIRIRPHDQLIAWTLKPPGELARQKLSTWNGMILGAQHLQQPGDDPVELNVRGTARRLLLDLVDGVRSPAAIEAEFLSRNPEMFPSSEEARRFIRRELDSATS